MKTILKHKNMAGGILINIFFAAVLSCTSFGSNRPNSTGQNNSDMIKESKPAKVSVGILPGDITIEEPVNYKNLQIFPVTSDSDYNNMNYVTLAEALDKNIATVIETGSVNELSITNHSDNYIYIMAGDIVKGGKQDRTMGEDYIIPPHVEKAPLKSYCIESGRWSPRGSEKSDEFTGNTKALSSKDLKLASRYEKNQSKVWSNVNSQQTKLNESLREETGKEVEVRNGASQSSLQLALENEELNKMTEDYKNAMLKLNYYSKKMVGYVYAVNGEIYGADIFGNSMLFDRLKPKLIDAIIVEAISELDEKKEHKLVKLEDVITFLAKAEVGEKQKEKVNKVTDVTITDNDDVILFETTDKENADRVIRKSYIKK